MDMKKAYDIIDDSILIIKPQHYQIRAISCNLKRYLSNRTDFVKVNGISSNVMMIICGLPKGTFLIAYKLYRLCLCQIGGAPLWPSW